MQIQMQDQLRPHLKVCGLKCQESFVAVSVYNRFEQKKTKIRIQIRDLHCLLGLVFNYILLAPQGALVVVTV